MKKFIFGINCPVLPDGSITYDGNVACLKDGKPLVALAEERISRKKYDGSFKQSFEFILDRFKITPDEIEAIAICSFAQPMSYVGPYPPNIEVVFGNLLEARLPLHYVQSHHQAHAMAAASQCPFTDALIVIVDHTGNLFGAPEVNRLELNPAEQTSYYLLRDSQITLVARDHDQPGDAGYGRVYGDITCQLGFNSYRESGKTMGLASFGDAGQLAGHHLFSPDDQGRERSSVAEEGYAEDDTKAFADWFQKGGRKIPSRRQSNGLIRPFDMHLAAWVQQEVQTSIERRTKALLAECGVSNVCMVGGVAMNSVMNAYLEETLGVSIFVPPSPGDAGLALGAAACYLYEKNRTVPAFGCNPYLGPAYDQEEMRLAIQENGSGFRVFVVDDVAQVAAEALMAGKMIGWFQGSSEYGPRALGNRSILASPRNVWTKEILNSQIKLREWFRPYAPVVRLEDAHRYFDLRSPVPHMMKTARVTGKAYQDLPACVHVDGTARVQTVTHEANPLLYELLGAIGERSGAPVLLNTSFNLAGMPIVESPADAIKCFNAAIGIDWLVMGNYILQKETA
ncbi:carbamoyltransferase C-terminal domain-containing protein [Mesoterricola silvestris]|nr:carbamoyltransferase C-terminal domain-containing protein [Mesoterricola silvestris]